MLRTLHFNEMLKGNGIVIDWTDLLRWSGWSCKLKRKPNPDFWFCCGAQDSNSPIALTEGAELSRVKGRGSDHWSKWEGMAAVQTHIHSAASLEKPTSQQPLLHLSSNSRTSSSWIQRQATWCTHWPTRHGATHRHRRFPSGGKGGETLLQWNTKDLPSLSRWCSGYCLLTVKSLSPPSHSFRMVMILAHCC